MSETVQKKRMDVAIVSCQECFFSRNAEGHLRGYFDKIVTPDNQKMDISLHSYDLKEMEHLAVRAEVHRAKVQIVIISHHFLDRLRHEARMRQRMSPINKVLLSQRVIAVFLGMNRVELIEGAQALLAYAPEWFTVELKSTTRLDLDFSKKFTEQVVKIYNVELSNTNNFSIFPKKVTKEQPKIVMLFKKPVNEPEKVKIEFSRGQNQMETMTGITLTNPHSAIIRIPESLCPDRTVLIEICVYVNEQKLGTKLIKFEYTLRNGEDDVIDRMTNTNILPGFQQLLDEHISTTLSKHFRLCTDFTTDTALELMNDALISRGDDFSTVMHFAAYYGLEKTIWTLLEESDGLEQSSIANDAGQTPVDVAKSRDFHSVVQVINDYKDTTNQWRAYQFIKDLCERRKTMCVKTEDENTEEAESSIANNPLYENDEVFTESTEQEKIQQEQEEINTTINNSNDEEENETNTSTTSSSSQYVNVNKEDVDDLIQLNDYQNSVVEIPPTPNARKAKPKKQYVNLKEDLERERKLQEERRQFQNSNCLSPITPTPMPNYDFPRPIAFEYSVPPPSTRPVIIDIKSDGTTTVNSNISSTPMLQKKPSTNRATQNGYLLMGDDKFPIAKASSTETIPKSVTLPTMINGHHDFNQTVIKSPFPSYTFNNSATTESKSPPPIVLDPTEEELIGIMTDYKNNLTDDRELEELFEKWKSRSDVQKSIEEQKAYLKRIRAEYNKIMRQKRPSAFGRVINLLTRRKKISNVTAPVTEQLTEGINTSPTNKGPSPSPSSSDVNKLMTGNTEPVDSISNGSGGSFPSETSTSDSENRDVQRRHAEWVNPLNKRCVGSYVAPDPLLTIQTSAEPQLTLLNYEMPPAPRPVITENCSPPPRPPHVQSKPPPLSPAPKRPSQDSEGSQIATPPPPPPRNHKPQSIFNYVDYKQKAK